MKANAELAALIRRIVREELALLRESDTAMSPPGATRARERVERVEKSSARRDVERALAWTRGDRALAAIMLARIATKGRR